MVNRRHRHHALVPGHPGRAICEDDQEPDEGPASYTRTAPSRTSCCARELDSLARRYPGKPRRLLRAAPPAKKNHGKGCVTEDLMREKLPAPEADTRIMLCGPPGMVKAAKSSLVDLGFEQPGAAAAKMTDQVFII